MSDSVETNRGSGDMEGMKPGGFVPEEYTPRRRSGVEELDRGEGESGKRFVLRDPKSGHILALSEEDIQLWRMFDGSRSAQDVLQEYAELFRTLPVDRLVSLIRDLWRQGFLLDDPGLDELEQQPLPGNRVIRGLSTVKFYIPGVDLCPAVLHRLGAGRFLCAPLFALFSAAAAVCIIVGYAWNGIVRHNVCEAFRVLASLSGGTLLKLLLLALAVNLAVSLVRETLKATLVLREGVVLREGGIALRWFVPVVYFDYPMLLAEPRHRRLSVLGLGVWLDLLLACAAVMAWAFRPETLLQNPILLVLALYPFLRLIVSSCPFMRTGLYEMLSDVLDEPQLRRRTVGFVKRNFGKTFADAALSEFLPYLGFGLLCVFWLELLLSLCHSLIVGDGTDVGRIAVAFGTVAIAIPVVLVAGSIVVWGGRILADGFREGLAEREREEGSLAGEWVGLAVGVFFTLFIPDAARKIFCLNITFFAVLGILVFAVRALKATWGTKPGRRFLVLALFAQVLWIPVSCLFLHTVASVYVAVPWWILWGFVAAGVAYLVVSVAQGGFLRRGPNLGVAEGFARLSVPLLLFCVADIVRLGRSWQDFAEHSFTLTFLVLGAGFLFLGFSVPCLFLRETPVVAQPFPFASDGTNEERLERSFSFFVTTLFDTILTSFGPASLQATKAGYNALSRRLGEEEIFEAWSTDVEPVRLATAEYGTFLSRLRQFLSESCGDEYVDVVFDRILQRVHWDCRVLFAPLVFPERADFPLPMLGQGPRLDVLKGVHLFRTVAADDLQVLAGCAEVLEFLPGERVVAQNTPCDAIYIVSEGVGYSEEWDIAGQRVVGAYLRPGDFFGEMALMTGDSGMHEFSIRATQRMLLVRIKKEDFEQFCASHGGAGAEIWQNVQRMGALRETPLFNELSPSLSAFLLARVAYETYPTGEVIIRQGDVGDRLYLISHGTAEVVLEKDNGTEEKVTELTEGGYFGEIALLMDTPRNATVRAVGDIEVGYISKSDFSSLRQGSRQFQEAIHTEARRRDIETQARKPVGASETDA